MAERYYIDTSIWRDLHEGRKDRFRDLGEWAFQMFKKIRQNKDKIIYSDLVIEELSIAFDKQEIGRIFRLASEEGVLERIEIKEQQAQEAAKLRRQLNVPFGDALHAVLARDSKAILIARDHHFEELTTIATIKKPEELI